MNKIFKDSTNKLLYSPMIAIYPTKINLYTEYIANVAKIFFKILNDNDIEYYLFAGSSIGLLRNSKSIPWVDDYDIIIFEKDMAKFQKIILILEKNLFFVKPVNLSIPILHISNKANTTFKHKFTNLNRPKI